MSSFQYLLVISKLSNSLELQYRKDFFTFKSQPGFTDSVLLRLLKLHSEYKFINVWKDLKQGKLKTVFCLTSLT